MPKVVFQDLGLIDYKEAWDYQEKRFNEILDVKKNNRKENRQDPTLSYLLFCEHPHVYTLGKSGDENNLLVNEDYLKSRGATFYKINRGGDITYHGPGQIVGYPILDLDNFFTDIHKYLRYLEEAVILTLADYGIESTRSDGETGVWLDVGGEKARKICALGVRSSRWVTMHGFAFNVNCDLSYFGNIIPCGIVDKSVTSMQKELRKEVDMQEVKHKLKGHLKKLFDLQFVNE
ncbi:MAG: lipoyl(octanoyl) transferase LipB [Flavobacteriia bacterium]|nr:lipoyl(octanoyl) transferase LipB [Flavobacteriia bacterium]